MMIRQSTLNDLPSLMNLIHQAQAYFQCAGIDQWQDGYPQDTDIIHDIEKQKSFVLEDTQIIGTMYFSIEVEPTYLNIDGDWLTHNKPYAVIHRIVVDENYKGQNLAKRLLNFAILHCQEVDISSIRIDTHQDNLSMQHFLTKNGFQLCGGITLESGAPRIAFEKLLNK